MLRARPGYTDDIHFLEGVVPDQVRGYLAGYDHQRDRIHEGRGNSGHGIGCTRSGGDQTYTDFAAGAGIAVSSMDRPLFVPDKDVGDVAAGELIVNVDDRPARVTENGIHPFVLQNLH